jgi:hypothetical protein
MLPLIGRMLGLFAFRSKNLFFLFAGIIAAGFLLYPTVVDPLGKAISMNQKMDTLIKLNTIDKAKLREPGLKASYDAIVKTFGKNEAPVAMVTAPPVKNWSAVFDKNHLRQFLSGCSFWVLLGIIGLFAPDAPLLSRLLSLAVFLVLGFGSGIAAGYMTATEPFYFFIMAVLGVELFLACMIGTLIGEVSKR